MWRPFVFQSILKAAGGGNLSLYLDLNCLFDSLISCNKVFLITTPEMAVPITCFIDNNNIKQKNELK